MYLVASAMLICLLALPRAAQQSDPSQSAKPSMKKTPPGVLHSVTIKGNHLYPAEAIFHQSGLRIGQRVSAQAIEDARAKLQGTELFNNVSQQYRFSGVPPAYDLT